MFIYVGFMYISMRRYVCVYVCVRACKCVHHFLQPLPMPHCPTGREHVATRESFEEGNSPEGKVKASSAVRQLPCKFLLRNTTVLTNVLTYPVIKMFISWRNNIDDDHKQFPGFVHSFKMIHTFANNSFV